MAYGEDNFYLENGDEVIITSPRVTLAPGMVGGKVIISYINSSGGSLYDVLTDTGLEVKGLSRGDLELSKEFVASAEYDLSFDMEAALQHGERCDACGNLYFIGEWPICNGTGDHSPGHGSHAIGKVGSDPPVVYYENSKGEIRFGDYRDAGFEPKGFQRREIEPWDRRSAEKFEAKVNQQERDKYDQIQVREQQTFEPAVKEAREELRSKLKTPQGKVLAAQAREITEKKNKKPKFDPGFSTVFNH